MLKTRVMTALVLLAVLLPVLFSNNYLAFAVIATVFFAAAMWESARLFAQRAPPLHAGIWTFLFAYCVFGPPFEASLQLFSLCALLWAVRFAPSLAMGLPALPQAGRGRALGNTLLNVAFTISLFGCFIAIVALLHRSPVFLLSVMALVWIADIGAYFSGKAFGRRKLAPSISPGKSWEGALGGGAAVLLLATASILAASQWPLLQQTFAVQLQARLGWPAALGILVILVAASVVGDLFESQLKRRSGMKDSSNLLPGHGGVLDRIDALIPVLPVAALIAAWL